MILNSCKIKRMAKKLGEFIIVYTRKRGERLMFLIYKEKLKIED
jgi:hypothetical protein